MKKLVKKFCVMALIAGAYNASAGTINEIRINLINKSTDVELKEKMLELRAFYELIQGEKSVNMKKIQICAMMLRLQTNIDRILSKNNPEYQQILERSKSRDQNIKNNETLLEIF